MAAASSRVVCVGWPAGGGRAGDRGHAGCGRRRTSKPGRWEAHGPGGASLSFVVYAEAGRRFAGAMVAVCSEYTTFIATPRQSELLTRLLG